MSNVRQIVLFGGAVRMPLFMNELKKAYGDDKIATTVNQEEAATLGATYMTASQRKGFRSKPVKIQDISLYKFAVNYKDAKSGETKSVDVFDIGSNLGTRKTVTFHRGEDFDFDLVWQDPATGDVHKLSTIKVNGVSDAKLPEVDDGSSVKMVKASIELGQSSLPVVKEIFVTSHKNGLGDKVLNWFGKGEGDVVDEKGENGNGKENGEAGSTETAEKKDENGDASKEADAKDKQEKEQPQEEKKAEPETEDKKQPSKVPATFDVEKAPNSGLKDEHFKGAKDR